MTARQTKLARIARAHEDWTRAHVDDAPFDPETHEGETDYPEHHLTVDATVQQDRELRRRVDRALS